MYNFAEVLCVHYSCTEQELTAKFLDNSAQARALLHQWFCECNRMLWYARKRSPVRVTYLGMLQRSMRTKMTLYGQSMHNAYVENGIYVKYPDLPLVAVTIIVKGVPTNIAVPLEMLY